MLYMECIWIEKILLHKPIFFLYYTFFPPWRRGPTRGMDSSFLRFPDHTQRRTTVSRTPLNKWSARGADHYLVAHDTQNKHPCLQRDSNPQFSRQAAANLRLRPRGHWDRPLLPTDAKYTQIMKVTSFCTLSFYTQIYTNNESHNFLYTIILFILFKRLLIYAPKLSSSALECN